MKKIIGKYKKGMIALCAGILAIGVGAGLVSANLALRTANTAPDSYPHISKADLLAAENARILFGKNEKGEPQEWYFAGTDTSISGENRILVAVNPIKESQKFQDDGKRNVSDSALWADCVYPDASNIAEVHPNHYGASDVRAQLKDMVTGTAYFSKAEQAFLNATTITTYDTRNRVNYTTADTLYLLTKVNGKLVAGSQDDVEIQAGQTDYFWLRTANGLMEEKGNVLTANSKNANASVSVEFGRALLPVTNLDMSSVLFASAASAGKSGVLDGSETMTLRMDGSGKSVGTARYDAANGKLFVVAGESTPVSLVVLGSGTIGGETRDWYYTLETYGSAITTTAMIQEALNITSEISLSDCKIWVESTDSTDNITYAVMAEAGEVTSMAGDFNGDSDITVADIYPCKRYLLGETHGISADVANANRSTDGLVNACDLIWMLKNANMDVGANPEEGWGSIQ